MNCNIILFLKTQWLCSAVSYCTISHKSDSAAFCSVNITYNPYLHLNQKVHGTHTVEYQDSLQLLYK